MSTSCSRRTVALIASAAALALTARFPAHADHGADSLGRIQQRGDGVGNTQAAIPSFHMSSILYDRGTCNGNVCDNTPFARGSHPRYPSFLAFGTIPAKEADGSPAQRLAMSVGSDDGLSWRAPQPAFVKDPSGVDVPFILNDLDKGNLLAVTYTGLDDPAFVLVYRVKDGDPFSKTAAGAGGIQGHTVNSLHAAMSLDGVHWSRSQPIRQAADGGSSAVIDGAAASTFKRGSYGPTDLIWQSGGSSAANCGDGNPWNCRLVMIYNAIGVGGVESVAVAGSPGPTGAGGQFIFTFTGRSSPILSPGAGFDSARVTGAHVRRVGSTYHMYYAGGGGGSSAACASGCSVGAATSTNGVTFAKSASNPGATRQLYDRYFPAGATPSSLTNPVMVNDALSATTGHAKIWITRQTTTGSNTFVAQTAPEPTSGPMIDLVRPVSSYQPRSPEILAFVTDEVGSTASKIGANLQTLSITLNGASTPGAVISPSIVTAYGNAAHRIHFPTGVLNLAGGTYTLAVSVADFDGNVSTVTKTFAVDTFGPTTTVTSRPATSKRWPGTLGTFRGTTIDGDGNPETIDGVGLERVTVLVRNPLNQERRYQVPPQAVTHVNGETATWSWTAPSDFHMLLPGNYEVSFFAEDKALNAEGKTAANTVVVNAPVN